VDVVCGCGVWVSVDVGVSVGMDVMWGVGGC
jgi:hypothetical protein